MLALEKARRLADEGFRTLLTCYNRPLADHLASLCADSANLDVMSFHQLCHRQAQRANRESGRNLLAEAKVTYPGQESVRRAVSQCTRLLDRRFFRTRYEAIICDEGQDFPGGVLGSARTPAWPTTTEAPCTSSTTTTRTSMRAPPPSRSAVSRFRSQGIAGIRRQSIRLRIRGTGVCQWTHPKTKATTSKFDPAPSRAAQAGKINGDGSSSLSPVRAVSPGGIAVLIADARNKADYYTALRRLPLPKPATWLRGRHSKRPHSPDGHGPAF